MMSSSCMYIIVMVMLCVVIVPDPIHISALSSCLLRDSTTNHTISLSPLANHVLTTRVKNHVLPNIMDDIYSLIPCGNISMNFCTYTQTSTSYTTTICQYDTINNINYTWLDESQEPSSINISDRRVDVVYSTDQKCDDSLSVNNITQTLSYICDCSITSPSYTLKSSKLGCHYHHIIISHEICSSFGIICQQPISSCLFRDSRDANRMVDFSAVAGNISYGSGNVSFIPCGDIPMGFCNTASGQPFLCENNQPLIANNQPQNIAPIITVSPHTLEIQYQSTAVCPSGSDNSKYTINVLYLCSCQSETNDLRISRLYPDEICFYHLLWKSSHICTTLGISCTDYDEQNQSCNRDMNCDSDSYCDGTRCQSLSLPKTHCTVDEEYRCLDGFCLPDWTSCRVKQINGQTCTSNSQCTSEFCNIQTQTCEVNPIHTLCTSDSSCPIGSYCPISGRSCAMSKPLDTKGCNLTRTENRECAPGLYCANTHYRGVGPHCTFQSFNGEPCESDLGCKSGHCDVTTLRCSTPPTPSHNASGSGLSPQSKLVIGIVVPVVGIVVLILIFLYRRKHQRIQQHQQQGYVRA